MKQFDVLDQDAIVYRSLLRKRWIDEDTFRIKADAYFLRPTEPGLSVNLASIVTPEQCAKNFRNCYGVASLEVGQVRQIGLEVEQDSDNHANIMGLPHQEDDLAEAERFAGLLAKRSRLIWQP
jgi:hypothetical protein